MPAMPLQRTNQLIEPRGSTGWFDHLLNLFFSNQENLLISQTGRDKDSLKPASPFPKLLVLWDCRDKLMFYARYEGQSLSSLHMLWWFRTVPWKITGILKEPEFDVIDETEGVIFQYCCCCSCIYFIPLNHRYNEGMKYLRLAFSFLTIIPVPVDENVDLHDLGRAAGWYPLVGALIGGAVALLKWGAEAFVPPFAAAVLAAGGWALLTGGLHLDGLADCCDGMLAAATPERRLEIMKDPRLGTFGGAGLVLQLLLKVALLSTLSGVSLVLAVPLAAALGRWSVLLAARQQQARSEGLGAAFAAGLHWQTCLAAVLVPLALTLAAGFRGLAAIVAVHLLGLGIFALARRRLGGVTGDVMGMLIELSETVVLLVFAAQWPPVF